MKNILEGSRAIAEAVKACKPDVIAAYPITPQTHIVEDLAKFVADGDMDSEYIMVESEFAAASAVQGSSAAGSRTYTATSSQGLFLMFEPLWASSGMRLPIVMTVANRSVSAPISIWNDQQDTISARDCGWLQLYGETNQEVADKTIQAYKIAENHDVLLPVMVCMDGFVLTHTTEPADVPDAKQVAEFLPPYKPKFKLDPKKPVTMGPVGFPKDYYKFRIQQQEAMDNALKVIEEVAKEFKDKFGRGTDGFIEQYGDGDVAIVSLGSVCGTIKDAIDDVGGIKLIKLECLRPFPEKKLVKVLKDFKAIGVLEKDISVGFGTGGVFAEIQSALYGENIPMLNFIAGIGGKDVTLPAIKDSIEKIKKAAKGEKVPEVTWI